MNLPYPSRPNLDQNANVINNLDKRMRSTIWSVKDIAKKDQNISARLRQGLIKLISKDKVAHLARKLTENSVNLQSEIGSPGSRWGLLHYCARWNAIACMEYIMRLQYKTMEDEYLLLVNAKTVEGDTPIMIAILYESREAIHTLLEYGGSDIYLINNNKMTAYQLAVSNKNQSAIKLLIEYEQANKHQTRINVEKLKQPYLLPQQRKDCCCVPFFRCFFNWAFREPKDKDLFDKNRDSMTSARDSATERPSIDAKNMFFDEEFTRTSKSICQDPQLLKSYQIDWYKAEDLFSAQNIKIFENFNPFETKQLNFALKHQLTIIQALARQPWLVRKIFKESQQKGSYCLQLFPKGFAEKIVVDDFIPCLKDKKQPMFLMNKKELWPMLLQKTLAKTYGCFINTRTITPSKMLLQTTGFPVETFRLSEFRQGLFQNLQSLIKSGYLVILTSKQDSKLQQEGQGSDSFSVLSFYDKDSKKLFLVNCPFLLAKWKEKDKNQLLSLRLIKAHFNNHNQMSLWFDEERINELFESFTVCYTSQNSFRNEIKAVSKEYFFFKFQISGQDEYEFLLKMYQYNDKQVSQVSIESLQLGYNDTLESNFTYKHSPSFGRITCLKLIEGEYFCKLRLPTPTVSKNLVMVMHGQKKIGFDYIDQEIGKVQWMYLLKEKILRNSKFTQTSEGMEVGWQVFCEYYTVVLRKKKAQNSDWKCCMEINQQGVGLVLQGLKQSPTKILFEAIDSRHQYTIFKISEGKTLEELQPRFSQL